MIAFDDSVPKEGMQVYLNTMSWQATGVINGLSGSGPPATLPLPAPSSLKRPVSALESTRTDGSDKDTIRALELALREVLDTVQAARYVFRVFARVDLVLTLLIAREV